MDSFAQKTFAFLSRSGGGKGTQAGRLQAYLEGRGHQVVYLYTGAIGRSWAEYDSVIGRWIRSINNEGKFFPDFIPMTMWLPKLHQELTRDDGIILFDGTPRKLFEAEVVDALLKELHRPPLIPILLDITAEESRRRIHKRLADQREAGVSRIDDASEAKITNRLEGYVHFVEPIIALYGDRVVRVDGMGTEDEVWNRLLSALESIRPTV